MITHETIYYCIDRIAVFLAYLLAIGPAGFFRAWTALKAGDDTAKQEGYLTFDPFAHTDLLGALAFILIGIGWSKQGVINSENITSPARKIKLFIVYFSDLFLHLAMALIGLLFRKLLPFYLHKHALISWLNSPWYATVARIIDAFIAINVFLSVISLIFNGVSLLVVLLGEQEEFEYKRYLFYASLFAPIFILMLFGPQLMHVFSVLILKIHTMFEWLF